MFNEVVLFTTSWFLLYRLIEKSYIVLYNKKVFRRIRNIENLSFGITHSIYLNIIGILSFLYNIDIITPISIAYLIFMTFSYFGIYSIYFSLSFYPPPIVLINIFCPYTYYNYLLLLNKICMISFNLFKAQEYLF